jgi:spore coat polysaccharide biosynthesis protein SpsF (cytidylyltransferase family)
VPDEPASEALERIAAGCGAISFRGSERDVLGRYFGAAKSVNAEIVLRVTSDCPLIDPGVCAKVLALREKSNADYACNNMPRSFPHGLDCEAFPVEALERAVSNAIGPDDYEHVTTWLRRDSSVRRKNLMSDNPALASHRWTLDYPEDLEFFHALSCHCPDLVSARMQDLLKILHRNPELPLINQRT